MPRNATRQPVPKVARFLLAMDVDGTLLTHDYRLLPEVRAAVQHARSHDIAAMLATARGPAALEIVLKDLGSVDFAICFGGAMTLERQEDRWHRALPDAGTIAHGHIGYVSEMAQELRLGLATYTESGAYLETANSDFEREFTHTGEPVYASHRATVAEPVFKMLAISDPGRVHSLETLRLNLPSGLDGIYSHANYLEIMARGVSKGTALTDFCKARGFGLNAVVAVGDSDNDVSMFNAAGHSAAMPDATLAARSAADWRAQPSTCAALARIIDHYAVSLWRIPALEVECHTRIEEQAHAS